MILPYRLLEPRLAALRQGSHTLSELYVYSLLVFLISAVAGGVLHAHLSGPAYTLMEPIFGGINHAGRAGEGSNFHMFLGIFFKNATAVLVTVALARRTRGISVALLVVLNGLIIGSLLTTLAVHGYPFRLLAAGFLTHGVVELGAVFLGAGLGLWLLLAREEGLPSRSRHCRLLLAGVVIPLLITAAFIESHITPLVMNALM